MSPAPTVAELLRDGRRVLGEAPHRPPAREAALLLGRLLGASEAELLAHGEREVAPADARRFRDLLERRRLGEPVAYLLGEREFYGRRFAVDRRVLIPRPETEHLIEAALALRLPARARVLDVGTGSGCIAITIALELAARGQAPFVVATDLAPGALAVARGNARRLGARVRLVGADLDRALDLATFDLVLSNPPYIGRQEEAWLSREVTAYEPHAALFSPGGSDTILRRLAEAALRLRRGAWLAVEMGFGQSAGFAATIAPPLAVERIVADYAGIDRVMLIART